VGEDLGVGWWFLWSAVGREREKSGGCEEN
jgi:hypothetical protein